MKATVDWKSSWCKKSPIWKFTSFLINDSNKGESQKVKYQTHLSKSPWLSLTAPCRDRKIYVWKNPCFHSRALRLPLLGLLRFLSGFSFLEKSDFFRTSQISKPAVSYRWGNLHSRNTLRNLCIQKIHVVPRRSKMSTSPIKKSNAKSRRPTSPHLHKEMCSGRAIPGFFLPLWR